MAVTTTSLRADEYLSQADVLPPRSELIAGEVVVNTPSTRHQRLLGFVYRRLDDWATEAPGRGEVMLSLDIRLDDDHVFAPDVLWFSEAHIPRGDVLHVNGPPDVAVEVRSSSTWRFDIGAKKAAYERFGLPELWLLDTAADTVLVFRRSSPESSEFDVALELGAGETLTSPLLPGFALDVAELFDR
ncbi:MAG: Uma2 family endonuclease [Actinomycetota bacterium]|nr:Uma2 family endonuclease [Actinomycetota bacterium]